MNRGALVRHHWGRRYRAAGAGLGTAGFADEGLAALDAALAGHTSAGAVPGLVALVARDGQVHVTSAGHKAIGDRADGTGLVQGLG